MVKDKSAIQKIKFYITFSLVIFALILFIVFATWYLRTPQNLVYTTIAPSHTVLIDDMKIHYVEEDDDGTQPPLLFVHGFASSTHTWYKMWPLLAEKYHLIAIDLPGFGLSDKSREPIYSLDFHTNILKKFIEKQIKKPTYIVSWSMGSLISLWLARMNPELFQKIVAITPALDPNVVFGPYKILPKIAFLLVPWVMTPQFIELTFKRVFAKEPQGEERKLFLERAFYPFWQNPMAFYSLINNIPVIKDDRNPNSLVGIKIPFLVLAGAKDKVVKLQNYDLVKKVFPDLNFFINADSGHCLHIEAPEWATEHTRKFFKL